MKTMNIELRRKIDWAIDNFEGRYKGRLEDWEISTIMEELSVDRDQISLVFNSPPPPKRSVEVGFAGPFRSPWEAVESAHGRLFMDSGNYVYWLSKEGESVNLEHYSHSDLEDMNRSAIELGRRCDFLEGKGVEISTTSVIWRWREYAQ